MIADRRSLLTAMALLGLGACAAVPGAGRGRPLQREGSGFVDIPFATWSDDEPEYLLYPGDEIEVATPTASELTRTTRVGPDGRITVPLVGQVMPADRTMAELELTLAQAYASQLVRPIVQVRLTEAGPLRTWVDGEVRTPGVYEFTGELDASQAIIQAGGILPTGRRDQVALIRRGPGGVRMMRVLDMRPGVPQAIALRRGDILFVPRTTLAELANFFGQIRDALPIGFTYSINGQFQQFP